MPNLPPHLRREAVNDVLVEDTAGAPQTNQTSSQQTTSLDYFAQEAQYTTATPATNKETMKEMQKQLSAPHEKTPLNDAFVEDLELERNRRNGVPYEDIEKLKRMRARKLQEIGPSPGTQKFTSTTEPANPALVHPRAKARRIGNPPVVDPGVVTPPYEPEPVPMPRLYLEDVDQGKLPDMSKINVNALADEELMAKNILLNTGTPINQKVRRNTRSLMEIEVEKGLREKDPSTIFAVVAFESSPWGLLGEKHDIKASDLEGKAKVAYYLGKGLGEVTWAGLSYVAGLGVGSILAKAPRAVKAFQWLGKSGKIQQAIRGTMKGLFVGSEASKAIVMHSQGYELGEIALDIGGDIAAFWAFGKGMERPLIKEARNQARRNFASRKSRTYIGEVEQELIWKEGGRTHYLKGKFPTVVNPERGALATKPRPMRVRSPTIRPPSDPLIRPPKGSWPDVALPDELAFLGKESGLPPKLYTEKPIVTRVKPKAPKVSVPKVEKLGGNGLIVLPKEAPKQLSIPKAGVRAREAMRIAQMKRELAAILRNIKVDVTPKYAIAPGIIPKPKQQYLPQPKQEPMSLWDEKRMIMDRDTHDLFSYTGPPKIIPEPPALSFDQKQEQGQKQKQEQLFALDFFRPTLTYPVVSYVEEQKQVQKQRQVERQEEKTIPVEVPDVGETFRVVEIQRTVPQEPPSRLKPPSVPRIPIPLPPPLLKRGSRRKRSGVGVAIFGQGAPGFWKSKSRKAKGKIFDFKPLNMKIFAFLKPGRGR